jgi:hypothetical protein
MSDHGQPSDVAAATFWQQELRWDDPTLDWQRGDNGISVLMLDMGDPAAEGRPLILVIEYAPDIVVRPHFHRTDYMSMVVRGAVTVSGRVHRTGSIRLVAAGTTYGPLLAGPEGVVMVDVFEDRRGAAAVWRETTGAAIEQLERATRIFEQRIARITPRPATKFDTARRSQS